jgi:hypothetical protein
MIYYRNGECNMCLVNTKKLEKTLNNIRGYVVMRKAYGSNELILLYEYETFTLNKKYDAIYAHGYNRCELTYDFGFQFFKTKKDAIKFRNNIDDEKAFVVRGVFDNVFLRGNTVIGKIACYVAKSRTLKQIIVE